LWKPSCRKQVGLPHLVARRRVQSQQGIPSGLTEEVTWEMLSTLSPAPKKVGCERNKIALRTGRSRH
jgi:hypothetical protein